MTIMRDVSKHGEYHERRGEARTVMRDIRKQGKCHERGEEARTALRDARKHFFSYRGMDVWNNPCQRKSTTGGFRGSYNKVEMRAWGTTCVELPSQMGRQVTTQVHREPYWYIQSHPYTEPHWRTHSHTSTQTATLAHTQSHPYT